MPDLSAQHLLALPHSALVALRQVMTRDAGVEAAAAQLQEAGYAAGEALYGAFDATARARTGRGADTLALEEFDREAAAFFRDAGWGSLSVSPLEARVAALDSPDWAEADPAERAEYPSCHFSAGVFAAFFGHVGGVPLGVMEVECRSTGDARCRSLLGSTEVLEHLYGLMSSGVPYEDALTRLDDAA